MELLLVKVMRNFLNKELNKKVSKKRHYYDYVHTDIAVAYTIKEKISRSNCRCYHA